MKCFAMEIRELKKGTRSGFSGRTGKKIFNRFFPVNYCKPVLVY